MRQRQRCGSRGVCRFCLSAFHLRRAASSFLSSGCLSCLLLPCCPPGGVAAGRPFGSWAALHRNYVWSTSCYSSLGPIWFVCPCSFVSVTARPLRTSERQGDRENEGRTRRGHHSYHIRDPVWSLSCPKPPSATVSRLKGQNLEYRDGSTPLQPTQSALISYSFELAKVGQPESLQPTGVGGPSPCHDGHGTSRACVPWACRCTTTNRRDLVSNYGDPRRRNCGAPHFENGCLYVHEK